MIETHDLISLLGWVVAAEALIVSIWRAMHTHDKASATNTERIVRIDVRTEGIEKAQSEQGADIKAIRSDVMAMSTRLALVEAKATRAHERIDEMERRIGETCPWPKEDTDRQGGTTWTN